MSRIAVVIGTRPDAIKMAPVVNALRRDTALSPYVIATGQHRELLDQAVHAMGLTADVQLGVMEESQTLAGLSARLMPALDAAIAASRPDFALVQGDTSTMLCAALVAFYRQVPLGHVEAGLRTDDVAAPFPEEANRRLVTPLATVHFAPTEQARLNLLAEGVADERVEVTGNTGVDAVLAEAERQRAPGVEAAIAGRLELSLGPRWRSRPTVLVTLHRRESLGEPLDGILEAIRHLAEAFGDHLFVYPVHLNPLVRSAAERHLSGIGNLRLVAPLGYDEFILLLRNCRLVASDSGGIQEEAPVFGKPVVVLRAKTERPEGIDAGVAVLAGLDHDSIVSAVSRVLADERAYAQMARAVSPYGDGRAAERIVARLVRDLGAERR